MQKRSKQEEYDTQPRSRVCINSAYAVIVKGDSDIADICFILFYFIIYS